MGWARATPSGNFARVFAALGPEAIGTATASLSRPDLDRARSEGRFDAHAFVIVFDRPVQPEQIDSIEIRTLPAETPLPRGPRLAHDRYPPLKIFVLGSPRSGTSEMGSTLTSVLTLPWIGEGHAAPLFAAAADALQGNPAGPSGLLRLMAEENFRGMAKTAARQAYFFVHRSASFVDKTPGVAMINAAPFIHECFPDGCFIFLWRNPVANVLSRIAKFGDSRFEAHCRDWAAAMNAWLAIRRRLPHYLEVRQEDMLLNPESVARSVAQYIGCDDAAASIRDSLASGSREHTGAGLGKSALEETGWSAANKQLFQRICLPALDAFSREAGIGNEAPARLSAGPG